MRICDYHKQDNKSVLDLPTPLELYKMEHAEQQGYEIVGESSDDNVSGMTFERKGLAELENAVDEGKVDVVLVKDLSRLGRHRTPTADRRIDFRANLRP